MSRSCQRQLWNLLPNHFTSSVCRRPNPHPPPPHSSHLYQDTRSHSNYGGILANFPNISNTPVPASPGWCRHFIRNRKDVMVRKVIKMVDPVQEKRKSSKEKWVTVDARPNKATSDFNLTMGEIMLGKSYSRIAVEGGRMVEEGVLAGLTLEKIFLLKTLKTLPDGLDFLLEEEKEQLLSGPRLPVIHRVGLKSMETWSSLSTPPGIIGVFKKPQPEDKKLAVARASSVIPLTVICDNIREPGNLGSILRSVAGAGCDEVVLTKGCVDPWNMKVLRGGSGAHFRLPISTDNTHELLLRLIEKKIFKTVAARSSNKSNNPKTDGQEDKFSISICDSNIEDPRLPGVPSTPFRDVDYTPFSHNFLIIGGETEGISEISVTTVKLLSKISSVSIFRIRIPLANDVESLNAANACGIIAFEISRQLTKH